MRGDGKRVRLGDVCAVVSGSTPKTTEAKYWGGKFRWVTPAEIQDDTIFIFDTQRHITEEGIKSSHLQLLPEGTVLLSSRAPIGKVAIAGKEMYCNQGFKNLICSDKIRNKYLYYYLKNKREYLHSLGRGATFKEISLRIVENLELYLPSLGEQDIVIKKLDLITMLIDCFHRQRESFDEIVKSRFTEMFMGDYLPVVVGDEFKTCSGGTPSRKNLDYYKNGTIPWLTSGEISKGVIREASQMITEDALNNSSAKIIPKNSVLIAMYGAPAGKVGLLQSPMTTNQAICAVLPNDDFNPYYTYYAFRNLERDMVERATGGAQPNISQQIIRQLEIKKPPIDIQNQFAEFVVEVDKSKLAIQKSIDELEILKKKLMQEYFG